MSIGIEHTDSKLDIHLVSAADAHLPIVDQVSVTVKLGELKKRHNFLVVASMITLAIWGMNFLQRHGTVHHASHSDPNGGQSTCRCTCTRACFQNIQCRLGIWGDTEEKLSGVQLQ